MQNIKKIAGISREHPPAPLTDNPLHPQKKGYIGAFALPHYKYSHANHYDSDLHENYFKLILRKRFCFCQNLIPFIYTNIIIGFPLFIPRIIIGSQRITHFGFLFGTSRKPPYNKDYSRYTAA